MKTTTLLNNKYYTYLPLFILIIVCLWNKIAYVTTSLYLYAYKQKRRDFTRFVSIFKKFKLFDSLVTKYQMAPIQNFTARF